MILSNDRVQLERLSLKHLDILLNIALEEQLWNVQLKNLSSKVEYEQYFNQALKEANMEQSIPFAIFDKQKNKYAGSTRIANIVKEHKRAEIGWTWIGTEFQGSGLNKAMKHEMLKYCFEVMNLNRVELKTDEINTQSRNAILSLGAKQEGIFRNHMVTDSGRIRNTVYFSILKEEWPEIKKKLELKF